MAQSHNAPAVQIASKQLEIATSATEISRCGMRPTVALRMEGKLDGPITYEVPTLDNNVNFWYAGVNVSYNLGALYKQKRKISASQAATHTARARLSAQTAQSEADTHAAFIRLQESISNHATHQTNVQLAHENYDVIHYRYLNGMALITDMLDATNQQLNAELQLVNSAIDILYRQSPFAPPSALSNSADNLGHLPSRGVPYHVLLRSVGRVRLPHPAAAHNVSLGGLRRH